MKNRLNPKHLKLHNIPVASSFRLNSLPGHVVIKDETNRAECEATVNWDIMGNLEIRAFAEGDDLTPWMNRHQAPGTARMVLTCQHLDVWSVMFSPLSIAGCESKQRKGETQKQSLLLSQPPADVKIAAPETYKCRHYRYWVPNFLFDGTTQLGKYRNRGMLDSFSFNAKGREYAFRHVADYKKIETKLKSTRSGSFITDVLEVHDVEPETENDLENDVRLLFHLMEAIYGLKIRPVVRAGYDKEENLTELLFYRTHAEAFRQPFPEFMANRMNVIGWPEFLQGILPGYFDNADKLGLTTACWQMVEARKLCVPSCMALLLMALENMATAYLNDADKGVKWDVPIDHKLNRCNKSLRCFPRRFTKELPSIRQSLRNPLFHQGHTGRGITKQTIRLKDDLFDACIALLAAICGFRGKISFICATWDGITLDEYAAGKAPRYS